MATTATLLTLPVELLHQISRQLSYGSHIALSFTCRELYTKLDTRRRLSTSSAQGEAYTMADLLEIEMWPEYSPAVPDQPLNELYPVDFLACCTCLRIRSAIKFCCPYRLNGTISKDSKDYDPYVTRSRLNQSCVPCTNASNLYVCDEDHEAGILHCRDVLEQRRRLSAWQSAFERLRF